MKRAAGPPLRGLFGLNVCERTNRLAAVLADAGLALACFALLVYARISPVWVAGLAALATTILAS
jgi:hypothetical protein